MSKDNIEMYEVISKIAMRFITDENSDPEHAGLLGDAVSTVLTEEYGEAETIKYVAVSLPIILGVMAKAVGVEFEYDDEGASNSVKH